ncbi:hypothetical protein ACFXJ8_18560 [Nonomuraea sp. NPDC059194]|uniref:hypothetical protein n=1 Tax=Nonomuraea sp. NPDC059194 TaxID=3346764 RepID=UPI0036849A8F
MALTAITTKTTFLVLIATLPGSRLGDVSSVAFDAVAVLLLAAAAARHRQMHCKTEALV